MNDKPVSESPHVRAWAEPFRRSVSLLVESHDRWGVYYGKPVVMEKVESDAVAPVATLRISNAHAQLLMDDLWACGLRPSEGSGSAGQLASVQQHLADMRSIAFHKLGMQQGGAETGKAALKREQ